MISKKEQLGSLLGDIRAPRKRPFPGSGAYLFLVYFLIFLNYLHLSVSLVISKLPTRQYLFAYSENLVIAGFPLIKNYLQYL